MSPEKGVDLEVDAAEIAKEIKDAAHESSTEEDIKVRTENILRAKVFERLGIPWARFEYTLVSGVRTDALYGHVILEYERPGALGEKAGFENAVEQVKRYIMDKAKSEAEYGRYFGIALDGLQICFVRYSPKLKGWTERYLTVIGG